MKAGIQLSNQLDALLQDEDLDQDKMKDAFEGLLPAISDYLNGVGPFQDGASLILKERREQIEKHGFTGEHHANHPKWYGHGQLTYAARLLCDEYSQNHFDFPPVNWDRGWWVRLCQKPYEERLIISGALIAAEIDRLLALEGKEANRG